MSAKNKMATKNYYGMTDLNWFSQVASFYPDAYKNTKELHVCDKRFKPFANKKDLKSQMKNHSHEKV